MSQQQGGPAPVRVDHRTVLRADCGRCVGLCCVAPAFAASSEFGFDKPAGMACPHLGGDFACDIHAQLSAEGFAGCVSYDCFGAGQQVTQVTYQGADWRREPERAGRIFAVFAVMRDLHELLWYLGEALCLQPADFLRDDLQRLHGEVRALTAEEGDRLATVDTAAYRRRVNVLLLQASELKRGATPPTRDFTRANLIGRDLRGVDMRNAQLFAACLIGADLRHTDLRGADMRGTDLRGADMTGADLDGCLFLVQAQVEAARGDVTTRLPTSVTRPTRWEMQTP